MLKSEAILNEVQVLSELCSERTSFSDESRDALLRVLSYEAAKYVAHSDIDDVVQEALIRLFRGISKYREIGRFRGWLNTVVARAALDFWRDQRRYQRVAKRLEQEGELIVESDFALSVHLQRLLLKLSAIDRMIVILVFIEERTHRETAKILGCSLVSVKVRSFRLKNKLRRWFNEEESAVN